MRLVLLTERLRLRRLTLDDAGLMLDIWNDPAFIRNVSDRGIRTIEDARQAMVEGPLKLYETYGYGPFRIGLAGDDTPVGICGLFRREGLDVPDIGYALLPDYYARGYAYEAAAAVVNHARSDLEIDHLVAIISPENSRSIHLVRKLGLEFERMIRLPGDDHDVSLYGIRFDLN